jgi:ribosomal protein S18 acetylase RimI-like enzyme
MSDLGDPSQSSAQSAASMLIRPYRDEDWPNLCVIHDAARMQELGASVGVEAFQTLEEVGVSEGLFDGVVEVGLIDDNIVGFVAYTPDELTWLYVDPALQGRGYGRWLLRHALAQGDAEMTTEALIGNDSALGLYLSEGFEIQECREGTLSGNPAFRAAANILKRIRQPE